MKDKFKPYTKDLQLESLGVLNTDIFTFAQVVRD